MLVHVIAHSQGCTNMVREPALKTDPGRKKSLVTPGKQTSISIAPGFSTLMLYQQHYPIPSCLAAESMQTRLMFTSTSDRVSLAKLYVD